MSKVPDKSVKARKVGAEDIIMIWLPADRLRSSIPSLFTPPIKDESRCLIALLAQACVENSFDRDEIGRTDDFHIWLRLASVKEDAFVKGADRMLPSMLWFSLISATSNSSARSYLRSFGFSPLNLEKTDLQDNGGSLAFPDGGRIEWTISGPGKRFLCLGVNHVIFVAADGPDAVGHRVAALVSDTVMDQPGKVRIQTDALKPYLFEGETFAASIHRMSKLKADVIWRLHQK